MTMFHVECPNLPNIAEAGIRILDPDKDMPGWIGFCLDHEVPQYNDNLYFGCNVYFDAEKTPDYLLALLEVLTEDASLKRDPDGGATWKVQDTVMNKDLLPRVEHQGRFTFVWLKVRYDDSSIMLSRAVERYKQDVLRRVELKVDAHERDVDEECRAEVEARQIAGIQDERFGKGDKRFSLGNISVTAGARKAVDRDRINAALRAHACANWGDVSDVERELMNGRFAGYDVVKSVWKSDDCPTFWIETNPDRTSTRVYLPSER